MDGDWYSVHVEARPPADAQDLAVDEDAADDLMNLLEEHDGVVSAGTGRWDATVSVRASTAWDAAVHGGPLIEKLACKAGMPSWPIIRAEAVRQDVLDAANAWPTLPELVSVPEAAELLRVSPQRVHELAATHATFPEPMYELRTGKLWLRDAIDAFAQRWERKPGRPRKTQAVLSATSATHTLTGARIRRNYLPGAIDLHLMRRTPPVLAHMRVTVIGGRDERLLHCAGGHPADQGELLARRRPEPRTAEHSHQDQVR
jgi:hypothetical protein